MHARETVEWDEEGKRKKKMRNEKKKKSAHKVVCFFTFSFVCHLYFFYIPRVRAKKKKKGYENVYQDVCFSSCMRVSPCSMRMSSGRVCMEEAR
jgi:hypothetical protein